MKEWLIDFFAAVLTGVIVLLLVAFAAAAIDRVSNEKLEDLKREQRLCTC